MDGPINGRWCNVPSDLRYAELRLPGTFRELCAEERFTNEQVGRILRCIALRTDMFLSEDIEPEVQFYRQDQEKRLNAKLRKAKSRLKLGMASKATMAREPIPVDPSVVIRPEPSYASTLAKGDAENKKRRRTHAEKSRDDLSDDLFSCVCDNEGTGVDRMRAVAKVNDPETPVVDSRRDAAWIPAKFAMFWENYPRKVAKSAALKAFTKILKSQSDVDGFMSKILTSLAFWKTQDQWTKDEGKFIPYPASWLNAGHWNDCDENKENKDSQATFLKGDQESDEDLIKRMTGG